jgi:hypothetical protein
VQKADGKKPSGKPGKSREAMLFDFYSFHMFILYTEAIKTKRPYLEALDLI